ncbi:MAG: hypothetical protein JK586_04975 [Nocardiopsis sp. BM-2018]|nr:MAG: hypothetical protein JK586_04975 [Nocardiopsis sp. BM-2018]
MRDVHLIVAWALIGANAAAGVWALAAHRWESLRVRALWAVVIVGQLLAFVSAFSGVALVGDEAIELDGFHALYGFSTIIAIGILHSYRTSPFVRGKEHLLYGLGSLFIMGLGIRNLYL